MPFCMETSNQYPPNYDAIVLAFPAVEEERTAIFCYGDTIHNPFDVEVTPDLSFHESVHKQQQGNDPDAWWRRYITDPVFRLHQEIEAYGAQFAFAKRVIDDAARVAELKEGKVLTAGRTKLKEFALDSMARALSGPQYGNILSYQQAQSAIRNKSKEISI